MNGVGSVQINLKVMFFISFPWVMSPLPETLSPSPCQGGDCFTAFLQWGLDKAVLRDIWDMVASGAGALNGNQFCQVSMAQHSMTHHITPPIYPHDETLLILKMQFETFPDNVPGTQSDGDCQEGRRQAPTSPGRLSWRRPPAPAAAAAATYSSCSPCPPSGPPGPRPLVTAVSVWRQVSDSAAGCRSPGVEETISRLIYRLTFHHSIQCKIKLHLWSHIRPAPCSMLRDPQCSPASPSGLITRSRPPRWSRLSPPKCQSWQQWSSTPFSRPRGVGDVGRQCWSIPSSRCRDVGGVGCHLILSSAEGPLLHDLCQ